jgi:hypothetical protein
MGSVSQTSNNIRKTWTCRRFDPCREQAALVRSAKLISDHFYASLKKSLLEEEELIEVLGLYKQTQKQMAGSLTASVIFSTGSIS